MSQSLIEDILHRITLTKIISDSTEASGWARLSFPLVFTWISFVSVLLIIVNWDRKENHHILASFLNWPVFPGKGTKVSLTEQLPEFREVEAAEGPLLFPITAWLEFRPVPETLEGKIGVTGPGLMKPPHRGRVGVGGAAPRWAGSVWFPEAAAGEDRRAG